MRVVALNQLVPPSEIFEIIRKQRRPVMLIENKILYTKTMYENFLFGYNFYNCDIIDSYPIINLKPEEGKPNLTIVCYGGIVDEVLKAASLLFSEEEILVDIFIISELTNSFIPGLQSSLKLTNKLCFVEEGNSYASYSSEVVANLHENHCKNFSLLRISNNTIIPSSKELELVVLPNSLKIKSSILSFL